MRVLVASPDKDEIQKVILPALEKAGAILLGYCISADTLLDKIKTLQPDLVLLRMDLTRRGEEEAFLGTLGVPVAVILPRGRANLRDSLSSLPNVRSVQVMPDVDYARLVQSAGAPGAPVERQAAQPGALTERQAAQPVTPIFPRVTDDPARACRAPSDLPSMRTASPAARRRATCLLFAGVKGGVGVTTSLCALAAAAVGLKLKVGVVDLTDTGDVQATLPKNSPVRILELDRAALAAQWPRLRIEHDLLLVDGGRLPALTLNALCAVGATLVCVTRADTTDRLPGDAGWVLVADAARAPVGLEAVAVFPPEPELFAQIERGDFLQPGPLLEAATTWAGHLRRAERHAEARA